MHKISSALKVIGLLAPIGAHALGIGEVKLYSALNQSFNAEIPLVLSGSESLNDIRVSLASVEAFNKAGIERNYILSKLHFKPVQKADGSAVIQVSSREGIREPFLNFLIAVEGSSGQMLREFTVLLDPSSEFEEVQPARLAERPKPSRVETNPVSEITHRDKIQTTGETYGPVRRDETLWSIAKLLNPDATKVSHERMLEAIYQANPEAFQNNDINLMKAGAVLKIPDMQVPIAHPRHATQENSGKGQAQLKLVSPGEAVKEKTDGALEVEEALRQENETLHSKLTALESELSVLKQSLSEKDEQIAKLSAPIVENQPAVAAVAPVAIAPVIPESPKPIVELPPPPEEGLPKFLAYIAAGLSLSLLGFLAYLYQKRKKESVEESNYFSASHFVEAPGEELPVYKPAELAKKEAIQGEYEAPEAVLIEDKPTQLDPIAEADVYLGYGRHKQAEDFMLKAIEQNPELNEYKLKLLEIYHVTENSSEFERYARTLFAEGKASDVDFWSKVVEMGKVSCPGNALFSGAEKVDPVIDLMADLKRFEERYMNAPQEAEPKTLEVHELMPVMEFDSPPVQGSDADIKVDQDDELGFEFMSFDEASDAAQPAGAESKDQDSQGGLEFDIQFFKNQAPSVQAEEKIEYENLIAFESIDSIEKPRKPGKDEFEFDLDVFAPLENKTGQQTKIAEEEGPYSDLTDMDEQETKLDLAKAYIDMGDEKTAGEILEDVLLSGSEAQKNEAALYLAKIAPNAPGENA